MFEAAAEVVVVVAMVVMVVAEVVIVVAEVAMVVAVGKAEEDLPSSSPGHISPPKAEGRRRGSFRSL